MSILVITTGGTIGAEPYEDLKHPKKIKTMPPPGVDPVLDALKKELAHIPTRYFAFEHRDSNLIDEPYRERLSRLIEQAPEATVLITHGTDTFLQTAEYFFQRRRDNPALKNKVLLLTGAMVPLACGTESDGYMNLKFSLEQLTAGTPGAGVYIVLCDFLDTQKQEGWAPRLYRFAPGLYEKYYDPDDARRCRLRAVGSG